MTKAKETAVKKLLAFRHIHFENLGVYHAYFEKQGYEITYVDMGLSDLNRLNVLDYDLLVVLGGPIGAYDDDLYPYLKDEIKHIEDVLEAKRPILGFCLGAQLIARALHADVYSGQETEIGWIPLTLTDAGRNSPVRHLDGDLTNMLHWHGDTFDLPAGAVRLASTPHYLNQVFSIGKHCLAFQCHPEFTSTSIESWLIGHACELTKHKINVTQLREESLLQGEALKQQGIKCIDEWVTALAL